MKNNLLISLKLTLVMLVVCSLLYPLFIFAVGLASPGGGDGETLTRNGKVIGYANIGQKFTEDKYFWGRPSAVDYNAAGSAGSNKAPSNPDYLRQVQERIDTFLAHNPGVNRSEIPVELVTASGSGLDPHISPQAAYLQVARVANARAIAPALVQRIVDKNVQKHLLGPNLVNVLKLNLAIDALESEH